MCVGSLPVCVNRCMSDLDNLILCHLRRAPTPPSSDNVEALRPSLRSSLRSSSIELTALKSLSGAVLRASLQGDKVPGLEPADPCRFTVRSIVAREHSKLRTRERSLGLSLSAPQFRSLSPVKLSVDNASRDASRAEMDNRRVGRGAAALGVDFDNSELRTSASSHARGPIPFRLEVHHSAGWCISVPHQLAHLLG